MHDMVTVGLPTDRRERLHAIIEAKSFSYGSEVTLSSGRKSLMYFNMKPTMLDREASYLIARELLEMADPSANFIGGLEMGAVPIISALCPVAFLEGREIQSFFVRKQAKDHGARKLIEGIEERTLSGSRVILVDDVTTSGASAMTAFDAIRSAGGQIVQVISVVDRQEGAADLFARNGVRFTPIFSADQFTPAGVH